MLVSFNPNYNFRNNYSKVNSNTVNFNGANLYRTTTQVTEAIKELANLTPFQKHMRLNTIAVAVGNDSRLANKNNVKLAMKYIPQEDEQHNATKYAIELIRLAKYSKMTDDELQAVQDTLSRNKFTASLDYSIENFKTKTTNKYGKKATDYIDRKTTRRFIKPYKDL